MSEHVRLNAAPFVLIALSWLVVLACGLWLWWRDKR